MPKPYKNAPLVDTLTAPPVIGQVYAVRCVWHRSTQTHNGISAPWMWLPVIGHAHRDPELGPHASARHYHFDFRFISAKQLYAAFGVRARHHRWQYVLGAIHWCAETADEVMRSEGIKYPGLLDKTVLAAKTQSLQTEVLLRRCVRSSPIFPDQRSPQLPKKQLPITYTVEETCRGQRIDPANPVCPHKGIALHSVPIINGCIDCPGHGLRFDATTGEIVSRYADLDEATQISLMYRLQERQSGGNNYG